MRRGLGILSVSSLTAFHAAAAVADVAVVLPLAPGYYMSPNGSDSNVGSLASPFLTLSKCQAALQAGPGKACYIRSGNYVLSAGLSLAGADAGETWSYYPPDGTVNSFTQSSAFTLFAPGTGADNVTITGLQFTGFESSVHNSCSGAQFVRANGSGNANGPNHLTVTNNHIDTVDCGIVVSESENSTVSFNQLSNISYATIVCDHCNSLGGSSTYDGNIFWRINHGGTIGVNAYGITFSTTANGATSNMTAKNNKAFDCATWSCYDDHGGTNIAWQNNLGVGYGAHTIPMFNSVALNAGTPITSITTTGNVIDNGFNGTAVLGDSIVMCGYSGCGNNTGVAGTNSITGNKVLFGSANGTIIVAAPAVTVSGNTGNINPETVSSINFHGSASATFSGAAPNGIVATPSINMTNTYWSFPIPPGRLSIGGTNSGGFVICYDNRICQPSGGTNSGTYSDFSITATLDGMYQSPYTQGVGSLTLVGN